MRFVIIVLAVVFSVLLSSCAVQKDINEQDVGSEDQRLDYSEDIVDGEAQDSIADDREISEEYSGEDYASEQILETADNDFSENIASEEGYIDDTAKSEYLVNGVVSDTVGEQFVNDSSAAAPEDVDNVSRVVADSIDIVGRWRIYSQALFYDKGGNDWLDYPSTRLLEIRNDGSWVFGASKGSWEIKDILAEDWKRWTSNPYGPVKKVVLNGWNNGIADGPIELSETDSGRIDFIWIIYRAEPPVTAWPGVAQIKFGRAQ